MFPSSGWSWWTTLALLVDGSSKKTGSTGSKMETISRPGNVCVQLGRLMLLGLVIFLLIFLIGDTSQYLGLTRICCGCYQSCCQALWGNRKDGISAASVHMSSLFAMSQLLLQTGFHLPICTFRLVTNAKKLPEAGIKTLFLWIRWLFGQILTFPSLFFPMPCSKMRLGEWKPSHCFTLRNSDGCTSRPRFV